MGYSRVIKVSDHKVILEHQLNPDGTPYAETITIETANEVDPSRLSHFVDGAIGPAFVSFSPVADPGTGYRWPSDKE